MKTLILAAFIITIGLASCSVSQPNEEYYPQQRVYTNPNYQYDPYYNPDYDSRYSTRRVYDYNTGRYYNVSVYSAPDYYSDNYRKEYYRRENNVRREYYRDAQPRNEQRVEQPKEKRFPDGTRISPDGTITLPNGEVKRNNR